MTTSIRVLYVDDYPLDRELVRHALQYNKQPFQLTEAATKEEFQKYLAEGEFDVVLTDFNILGFEGLQVLDMVQAQNPHIPVIIVTGTGTEEVAVEAMKRGAADYVIKTPLHIQRLPRTIEMALEKQRLQQERERARQQLQALNAELEQRVLQRTRELQEANERLQELDRLKSKFIADVSHELRTPVTNLSLYLSLMEHGHPSRREHYMKVLKEQVERLSQLIEDILRISNLTKELETAEFVPIDLNTLVNEVVELYRQLAEDKGLTLSAQTDPNLPKISGVYKQLFHAVANLVVNGIQYTVKGSVTLITQYLPETDEACLVVEDTGIGIHPSDLPHLFDRFYRGQHTRYFDVPGAGIGLGFVKEVVAFHKGHIEVTTEEGKGSTFTICLPCLNEEE
ncbi:MAG: hybrid sensor histidine kinase/response regulator [Chloroflexi bacterium]|nr:MAG: hybrid sensor histidine kinase/response regulator [Chloroflexota bacterium]